MLNYLKLTVRRLVRQKAFSLINIMGLSIGIAACLLIYLYVHNELTYDGYNLKKDRIGRVTSTFHSPESDLALAITPTPLAATLQKEFPEVEKAANLQPITTLIRRGKEVFKENDFLYSETPIFDIFTFEFREGSPETALKDPGSIVLTSSLEKKYFPNTPALGQTLTCNSKLYKVTAVIADRPANSDIKIGALLYKDFQTQNWIEDFTGFTFVLFRGNAAPDWQGFTKRMAGLSKYTQPQLDNAGAKGYSMKFQIEPLKDVHFSAAKLGDNPKGNRQLNTIFSALALFILIIALLNYINLSTTKAIERAKEVGVRKVIGARPLQLIRQFLGESSFLIAIAWLLAIGLVLTAIPFVNKKLDIQLVFGGWQTIVFLALLFPILVAGAGLYPAFVLSGFRPIKALKGQAAASGRGSGGKSISLRKVLTVVQFVIALLMLAGTAVIYDQMQYVSHKDLGADRSQVLSINFPRVDQIQMEGGNDSLVRVRAHTLSELLRHESGIEKVSVGSGMPVEGVSMGSTTAWSNGKKREMMTRYFDIDPQFLPLLKIPLKAGRNLSDSFSTDKTEAFIVNESFVSTMGWKDPIGQNMEGSGHKGKVIGVVKNFFYSSLHNAIEPVAMVYSTNPTIATLVKTTPQKLPRIKELWIQIFPERPFDYYFLDENFAQQYKKDNATMYLFNTFTALAILISCLGLYGLVALITLQRTKEIGIRKVLGASVVQLVTLQSKDQIILIGWASLIALPLAGIFGSRWLSTYAWHTQLNIGMFLLPVVAILLLALSVTGLRILRSAQANPVKSLKTE
ncbi:MAG: ABC transporter permease [Bacteroidetes bacterium]|nr:ABC transporter permease [Bacteroidota bacterium]